MKWVGVWNKFERKKRLHMYVPPPEPLHTYIHTYIEGRGDEPDPNKISNLNR